MNAIALGMMLVSSLLHAVPGEEDLGEVGESCRSRADCRSGLKCLANVCAQESREGQACGATRECGGGGLRCLERVCRMPQGAPVQVQVPLQPPIAQGYVPPPPPEWAPPATVQYGAPAPAPYAAAPQYAVQQTGSSGPPSPAFNQSATVSEAVKQEPSTLEGTHGYLGGSLGIGPGTVSDSTGGVTTINIPLAIRGGVWFGRFDLQAEFSPFTDLAVGSGAVPALGFIAKPGFLAVMHERGDFAVGWMFRLGAGAGVMATCPSFRVYAQVIGIGIRTGNLHMEFALPIDAYVGALSFVKVPLTFAMTYVF